MSISVNLTVVGLVLTALGLVLTTLGIYLNFKNSCYNKSKDQKTEDQKKEFDKDNRISEVVERYLKNESDRIINGKSGLIKAGAGLLLNDGELDLMVSKIIARGSKNPFGEDYKLLKEQNRLMLYIKVASKFVSKSGLVSKSSEEIINLMDEEEKKV